MRTDRPVVNVSMESDWATWRPGRDGQRDLLLLFPLPGSHAGRAVYALFITGPGGESQFQVSPAQRERRAIFAHLSRSHGQFNSACYAESGHVEMSVGSYGRLIGRFSLTCPDGTELIGRFTARCDDAMVVGFEREYLNQRGNIARLAAAAAPPADADEPDPLGPLIAPRMILDDGRTPLVIIGPTSQPGG